MKQVRNERKKRLLSSDRLSTYRTTSGALYAIESEIRGRPPDQRQAVRQASAGRLLDELYDWLQATLGELSKKSELAVAIRYVITRWTALTRYRDNGDIEIDNNAAERSLRAVAIGRKNYLFARSGRRR